MMSRPDDPEEARRLQRQGRPGTPSGRAGLLAQVDALVVRARTALDQGTHADTLAAAVQASELLDEVAAADPQAPGVAARRLETCQLLGAAALRADDPQAAVAPLRAAVAQALVLPPIDPVLVRLGPELARQLRSCWQQLAPGRDAERSRTALLALDEVLLAGERELMALADQPATLGGAAPDELPDHPALALVEQLLGAPTVLEGDAIAALRDAEPAVSGTGVAALGDADVEVALRARFALADAQLRVGRRDAALATVRGAAALAGERGVGEPLAVEVDLQLAAAALEAEDHAAAGPAATRALARLEGLVGGPGPQDPARTLLVVQAHHLAGCAAAYGEDQRTARPLLERAAALLEPLLGGPPAGQLDVWLLAGDVLADLAYVRRRQQDRIGDTEAGELGLDRLQALLAGLPAPAPVPARVLRVVARALTTVALARGQPHRPPGPGLVQLAAELLARAVHDDPGDGNLRGMLAQLWHLLAMLRLSAGDVAGAGEAHQRSQAAFDAVWRLEPRSVWTRSARCESDTVAAALDLRAGRASSAGRRLRAVVQERRAIVHERPTSPWAHRRLVVAHRELARTAVSTGARKAAVAAARAMVAAAEQRRTLGGAGAVEDLDEAVAEARMIAASVGDRSAARELGEHLIALRREAVGLAARDGEPVAALIAARIGDLGPDATDWREVAEELLGLLDELRVRDPGHPRLALLRFETHHRAAIAADEQGQAPAAAEEARAALAVRGVLDPATDAGREVLTELRHLVAAAGASDPGATSASDPAGSGLAQLRAAEVRSLPAAQVPTSSNAPTPIVLEAAGGARPGARFGQAVALAGQLLVVGAPGAAPDTEGRASAEVGTVQVLRRTGDGWVPDAVLVPHPAVPGSRFGWSVATDGQRVVIGAPGAPGLGPRPASLPGEERAGTGAVHVFVRRADGWQPEARLVPPPGAPTAAFGTSVALDADHVAVGDEQAADDGAVALYRREASGYRGVGWLRTPGGQVGDGSRFGAALALAAGRLLVGAPGYAPSAGSRSLRVGAAFLVEQRPEGWRPVLRFDAPLPSRAGDFGAAVLLGEDLVAVGAPATPAPGVAGLGAVSLFVREHGAGWRAGATLQPPASAGTTRFGTSLAAGPTGLLVGAPLAASEPTGAGQPDAPRGGVAWRLRLAGDGAADAGLLAADAGQRDAFGTSLAAAGVVQVVGAPLDDAGPQRQTGGPRLPGDAAMSGVVYVFGDERRPPPARTGGDPPEPPPG